MTFKIATIEGDGIGEEVVKEALKVITAAGVDFQATKFNLGAERYLKDGKVLPENELDALRKFDAIMLGAVGPPIGSTDVPAGLLERGLLLKLRFSLDLYINLRPFIAPKGSVQEDADFAVVRENTEGTYAGEGGLLRQNTPFEVATQGSVNTRFGVERCVRFAFQLAMKRRKHLTLVHKTNVLTFSGGLWQRTFDEVSKEFPEVKTAYNHIDAACIYMVEKATAYDVIVTDNLFGDILTDLAGAVTGGIGLAASANLNPEKTGPSLFEPVHGAAHDIKGTGKANPLAAIKSAALMLDHLGEETIAQTITDAVTVESQILATKDLALTTSEIGDRVAERVANANNSN